MRPKTILPENFKQRFEDMLRDHMSLLEMVSAFGLGSSTGLNACIRDTYPGCRSLKHVRKLLNIPFVKHPDHIPIQRHREIYPFERSGRIWKTDPLGALHAPTPEQVKDRIIARHARIAQLQAQLPPAPEERRLPVIPITVMSQEELDEITRRTAGGFSDNKAAGITTSSERWASKERRIYRLAGSDDPDITRRLDAEERSLEAIMTPWDDDTPIE